MFSQPVCGDATIVSPLHRDGTPHALAPDIDGASFSRALERKENTYPELASPNHYGELTVLACETGGRWSRTCATLLTVLAVKRAQEATPLLQAAARMAWASRWWAMLGVAQQSALAATISESALGDLDGIEGDAPPLAEALMAGEAP